MIDLEIFIISFMITLMFVLMIRPSPKLIYIYPIPSHTKKELIYSDLANNCYSYEEEEVACTPDASTFPIQGESLKEIENQQESGGLLSMMFKGFNE